MAKTKAPAVKPRRAKSSNAEPPTATPASETCPGETAEETIARHRAWIRAQLTKLIALRSKALEYNSYGPLPDSTRLDPRSPAWRQQRELARRLGQHEEMLTKLVIRTAVRWLLILDHATVETLQVIEEAILFAHYETALSSELSARLSKPEFEDAAKRWEWEQIISSNGKKRRGQRKGTDGVVVDGATLSTAFDKKKLGLKAKGRRQSDTAIREAVGKDFGGLSEKVVRERIKEFKSRPPSKPT